MRPKETTIEDYEQQHKDAEPLFQLFGSFIKEVRRGDLDTLRGLRDWLDVELMISHFDGAQKQLYRAAVDLCEEEIRRKANQPPSTMMSRIEARLELAAKRMAAVFDT